MGRAMATTRDLPITVRDRTPITAARITSATAIAQRRGVIFVALALEFLLHCLEAGDACSDFFALAREVLFFFRHYHPVIPERDDFIISLRLRLSSVIAGGTLRVRPAGKPYPLFRIKLPVRSHRRGRLGHELGSRVAGL